MLYYIIITILRMAAIRQQVQWAAQC